MATRKTFNPHLSNANDSSVGENWISRTSQFNVSDILNENESNITMPLPSQSQVLRFKTILVGDISVGKTSIISRIVSNSFSNDYVCNVGVELKSKEFSINKSTNIQLNIWDTSGEERFRCITKQYYRDANSIILVFDWTDYSTFESLGTWWQDIRDNQCLIDIPLCVVGNKADDDVRRCVNTDEIKGFLVEKKLTNYFEVSAKTGKGIDKVIENVILNSMETYKKGNDSSNRCDRSSWVSRKHHKRGKNDWIHNWKCC